MADKPSKDSASPSNESVLRALEDLLEDPPGYFDAHVGRVPVAKRGALPAFPDEGESPSRGEARKDRGAWESFPAIENHLQAARKNVRLYGGSFAEGVLTTLLNMVLFVIIFLALDGITRISGSTQLDELKLLENVSIKLAPLPLWLNLGCGIGAGCFLIGMLMDGWKQGLGLIVGITVSLTTLLSYFMEGSIGMGAAFGFGISIACLMLALSRDSGTLNGREDVRRVAWVAGLAIVAIIGPGIHVFAALLIALVVILLTSLFLSLLVVLRR